MTEADQKRKKNILKDLDRLEKGLPVPVRTDGGLVVHFYERVPKPDGRIHIGFGGHVDIEDLDVLMSART